MSRIVIAHEHAIIRRGLTLILSETDDLSVACNAVTSDELFARLRADHIDLVMMSPSFSGGGIDVLRRIHAEFASLPVLIFNSQADDLLAPRVLRAGASGYIQNDSTPDDLVIAIRSLLAGHSYVSTVIAATIASDLSLGGEGRKPHERLSRRELEIFCLIGSGESVGLIAGRLKLSVKTVSTHRTRILAKTGLLNNAGIIRYAITNRLL
jgi:two-component system invasion response regulator UvrY